MGIRLIVCSIPDSNVRGTSMGPTWGRQDPGGHHVGQVNLAIWDVIPNKCIHLQYFPELIWYNHVCLLWSQSWWRHHMETFSALLALCAGNSPVTGEFPSQRPVTLSFHIFFDLRLNKRLSKQWSGWWFETPSRSLWRHCNVWQWHQS